MNPRIHIEFAFNAPVAAILRRGPSQWVQLFRWDTGNDTIDEGSWFHGQIYESGCTLSPDGKLLAYFATKYHGKKTRGVGYAWTAMSKLPWLSALVLWPQSDTWGGNASFVDNETLLVDCPHWERLQTKDRLPPGFTGLPRWIGKDAPMQSLPAISVNPGHFQGAAGVDQSGRAFKYVAGKLIRDGAVIVDFTSGEPQPEAPPDFANLW